MNIAIDYDGTITSDAELWFAIIKAMRGRGHTVMIVTMRHENEPIHPNWPERVDRVVYTRRKGKARHMAFLGLQVDIWIDDMPHFILTDAADARKA